MIIFISLAGHIAVAYLHILLSWRFYSQRRDNFFVHLFWILMILSLVLHSIYAIYYLALLFGLSDLIKYITVLGFSLLAFYPAILATLVLGQLTEQPIKRNLIANGMAYISKDPRKLFMVCIGIAILTILVSIVIAPPFEQLRYIGFGNPFALGYLLVLCLLWLLMFLLGFRAVTKRRQFINPFFGFMIAVFLVLSIMSVLIEPGHAWSLIPIISTTGLSLSFCWSRFRTQFMDVIFNQFIRIVMLIAIVVGLSELFSWMNLKQLSSGVQMLTLFSFLLTISLLFRWLSLKLTSLWHPPIETLAQLHAELPTRLTLCTDISSSIEQTEQYLSALFSTQVAINRSLPDSVQSLSLNGVPQIEIQLTYMRQWMPWFSEALNWVRTAGLYLQSHLKILQSLEQEHQQKLKTEELTSLAAKAELLAMRSQIRPHFLFNILNSIHHFVRTEPQLAEQTIEILSEILRSVLTISDKDKVPLHQELNIAEKYLSIEKIRYGEQFEYQLHIEKECHGLLIPPFCVQPLVENAIKHAVDSQFEPVLIVVNVKLETTHLDNEQLVIQVLDDGPGLSKQSSTGLGIALKNIKSRLKLLYGTDSELILENRPEKGTIASVNIPIQPSDVS